MRLKRLYNHEAPEDEWVIREETCPTCGGKGVVINESLDGVDSCPDCEDGIQKRLVPPVSGIRVLYAGPVQHISPRIVQGGQQEGWLTLEQDALVFHGEDGPVEYHVVRPPGRYPVPGEAGKYEVINYYDCELVGEIVKNE